MSKVLQVSITCSNGHFEEQHNYFIPICKVIDWCDEKYGVRKNNKDIDVVSLSLLDSNHNPIENEVEPSESCHVLSQEVCEVSDIDASHSALLAALGNMGSYDDDLTLSDASLFDCDLEFSVGSVDPDDHWN